MSYPNGNWTWQDSNLLFRIQRCFTAINYTPYCEYWTRTNMIPNAHPVYTVHNKDIPNHEYIHTICLGLISYHTSHKKVPDHSEALIITDCVIITRTNAVLQLLSLVPKKRRGELHSGRVSNGIVDFYLHFSNRNKSETG